MVSSKWPYQSGHTKTELTKAVHQGGPHQDDPTKAVSPNRELTVCSVLLKMRSSIHSRNTTNHGSRHDFRMAMGHRSPRRLSGFSILFIRFCLFQSSSIRSLQSNSILCPTLPPLYLASGKYPRSMSIRHGSFPAPRHENIIVWASICMLALALRRPNHYLRH